MVDRDRCRCTCSLPCVHDSSHVNWVCCISTWPSMLCVSCSAGVIRRGHLFGSLVWAMMQGRARETSSEEAISFVFCGMLTLAWQSMGTSWVSGQCRPKVLQHVPASCIKVNSLKHWTWVSDEPYIQHFQHFAQTSAGV